MKLTKPYIKNLIKEEIKFKLAEQEMPGDDKLKGLAKFVQKYEKAKDDINNKTVDIQSALNDLGFPDNIGEIMDRYQDIRMMRKLKVIKKMLQGQSKFPYKSEFMTAHGVGNIKNVAGQIDEFWNMLTPIYGKLYDLAAARKSFQERENKMDDILAKMPDMSYKKLKAELESKRLLENKNIIVERKKLDKWELDKLPRKGREGDRERIGFGGDYAVYSEDEGAWVHEDDYEDVVKKAKETKIREKYRGFGDPSKDSGWGTKESDVRFDKGAFNWVMAFDQVKQIMEDLKKWKALVAKHEKNILRMKGGKEAITRKTAPKIKGGYVPPGLKVKPAPEAKLAPEDQMSGGYTSEEPQPQQTMASPEDLQTRKPVKKAPATPASPRAKKETGWVGKSPRQVKDALQKEFGIKYTKGWHKKLPFSHPAREKFRKWYKSGRGK